MHTKLNHFILGLALIAAVGFTATVAPAVQSQAKKGAKSTGPAGAATAERITAQQLRSWLEFVASDDMEGRDTPSRGLDITAKFLASHLAALGLRPAGDNGTYFQKIALTRTTVDPDKARVEINGKQFVYGTDFIGSFAIGGEASGQVVYVSHGWVNRQKGVDAHKGVDVKGKIVVIAFGATPKGIPEDDLFAGKRGVDWDDPFTYARKAGAAGIILVPGFQTMVNWENSRKNTIERGQVRVDRFRKDTDRVVPVIFASPRMLTSLFEGESVNGAQIFKRQLDDDPGDAFALGANKTVRMSIATRTEALTTQNVVAVLEGSDPVLKNEYVAMGAHYDHVGIGNPVNGDSIYNGADDDGSGTVGTLAIATAFAQGPPPKRSLLFVWHTGEEKGLWGSEYFTRYPTVPLDRVVTQLNMDMLGRSKPANNTNPRNDALSTEDEIYVIGSKLMSSELGALNERVNDSFLKVKFNYKYDDPNDPLRLFYRSDHYNYAKHGVPIIFYFDGESQWYHRPSDEPDTIDYGKFERVTRTVCAVAYELANAPTRPRVDNPLPSNFVDEDEE